MVGFMETPLAWAADISVGLARRLDMPIWAVPSVMAAMPVVEPSAAISKAMPGFLALYSSASMGTSLAPRVSEPLMTSLSAARAAVARAATERREMIFFIGKGKGGRGKPGGLAAPAG